MQSPTTIRKQDVGLLRPMVAGFARGTMREAITNPSKTHGRNLRVIKVTS